MVEDSYALAETYKAYLKSDAYEITCVNTGQAALEVIAKAPPDVTVLDVHLPDMNGIDILRELKQRDVPTDVIIITGQASVNLAVDAMREGAADFIMKPCTAERLRVTVRNAVERRSLEQKIEKIQEELHRDRFVSFIGRSPAMQTVYQTLQSAAPSDATVFVRGESGTGKELCAEALHQLSPRRNGPHITLNCAAIPRDLLESEIFGHVKGAFTGATRDRKGAAMRAHGGTLFLDEICEMDLSLQSKLLRFLQERTVQRVGEDSVHTSNVRIVCATNREPMEEVRAGRFREDLFYRLHVVPLVLPPLRDRGEDVVLIAEYFLRDFAEEDGKSFAGFADDARRSLMSYAWPGNVRQLQNIIRQIVVMNSGGVIDSSMLPVELSPLGQSAPVPPSPSTVAMSPLAERGCVIPTPLPRTGNPVIDRAVERHDMLSNWMQSEQTFPQTSLSTCDKTLQATPRKTRDDIVALDLVIRQTIKEAIALCGGSVPEAARALDVSPSTLYRRLQSWAQMESDLGADKENSAA